MPVYNPTDANFLTVAQSRTNNGQRDVRVLLDIASNIFYTLDDDGNLIQIQSSGGGGLDATLLLGNTTGTEDIIMSSGTIISGKTDVTLQSSYNDVVSTISAIGDSFNVYNNLSIVDNNNPAVASTMQQFPEYFTFNVENIEKFTIDGRTNYFRNENFNLIFPLTSNEYYNKRFVAGGLNDFFTTDNLPVTLCSIEPTSPVVRLKLRISAYNTAQNKGYYEEVTAALKLDANGDYQPIGGGGSPIMQFSDFSLVGTSLGTGGPIIQVIVVGEVGLDIGWVADVEYSDQL